MAANLCRPMSLVHSLTTANNPAAPIVDTAEVPLIPGVIVMISSIGSSLACYGQSQSQSSTTSLSQTEEKLFADIDTNGDGSVSKSELTSFLDKSSGAMGATQPSDSTVSSLFASMDSSGDGSISLSEFQSNASSLADQLRSQLAQAASSSGSSSAATSASLSSSAGTTGASTSST